MVERCATLSWRLKAQLLTNSVDLQNPSCIFVLQADLLFAELSEQRGAFCRARACSAIVLSTCMILLSPQPTQLKPTPTQKKTPFETTAPSRSLSLDLLCTADMVLHSKPRPLTRQPLPCLLPLLVQCTRWAAAVLAWGGKSVENTGHRW